MRSFATKILLLIQTFFFVCYSQLTFPTSFISMAEKKLTLYFEFYEQNKTVLMGLESPLAVDYFSVGFADVGKYGMIDFDMVAFVFIPDASKSDGFKVKTMDLYSTENSAPPTDVSLGGTSDYVLVDSYVNATTRQVLFSRKWNTGDKYDYVLDPRKKNGTVALSWAYVVDGMHTLDDHGPTAGTITAKLSNGYKGAGHGEADPNELIIKLHAYFLLFAWLVLIEVAMQFGRYSKSSKHIVLIHTVTVTAIYVLTVVFTVLALVVKWNDVGEGLNKTHCVFGWVILIVISAQVLFGLLLVAKIKRNKDTKHIRPSTRIHLFLGILIYLITKAEVAIGLYLWNESLMIYVYIFYPILFALRIFQELMYKFRNSLNGRKHVLAKKNSSKSADQKLIALLNANTPVSEIMEDSDVKNLKWTVLDNHVFKLAGFNHPGGNFIYKHIIGQEIGKFIYGVYGLADVQATQHHHTSEALSVVSRNYIGRINNSHRIFTSGGQSVPVSIQSLNRTSEHPEEQPLVKERRRFDWTLKNKIEITPTVSKIEFKKEDCLTDTQIHDIRHLGRHVNVSHRSKSKIRMYTLMMSQSDVRIKRREALWKKFQNMDYDEEDVQTLHSTVLPLFIKRYERKIGSTFSKFVHIQQVETFGFCVEGPFGLGLGITPKSTGLHYIIAAGTGIFPFIDLFDYLLEAIINPSEKMVDVFKNGFRLHVFVSLVQIDDFVGMETCGKLLQALKILGYDDDVFKLTIRTSNAYLSDFYPTTKERFDQKFIDKNIDKQSERIYVCGPPEFNRLIPSYLGVSGFSMDKVVKM